MAQNVSELWNVLWGAKNTEREYAFDIDGVWYGPESEVEHKAESALYSDFGIGNATNSSLTINLFANDIPRAAKIKRYIRLVNGSQESEWLPKGIFWANRRAVDDGYWTIEAFDGMRKADKVWEPDQSLVFPMPMSEAVEIIAALMGVEIDPRCNISEAYTIDYPVSDQTFRKTLQWIAAAHGGNFIITDEGKLLLVPLISAPSETSYLVTEDGAPIIIGGRKIIVDASWLGNENGASFYVGKDIVDFADNGKYKPISRVTLLIDDENALTAGDDTGLEIVADCPYATQAMVATLLAYLKGYQYQSYEAGECNVDPSVELGDGLTVNGLYAVIGRIVDDGDGYPSLSAPGEAALDDEYPSGGPMQQEFSRKIAETRAIISKTAEAIRQEVSGKLDGESASAMIETAIKGITLAVSSKDGSTTFTLTGAGAQLSAQKLDLTVDAVNITGVLKANQINLTGSISWGDLATDAQNQVTSAQNMALSAYTMGNTASNQVSAWTYPGSTYINGSMIMAGTVMASQLLGGYVGLLNAYQQMMGQISIGAGIGGYAIELNSTGGGLRLSAASNFWVDSAYGSMGITNSGIVCTAPPVPYSSGNVSLGTYGFKWSQVYAATGTINTSDRTEKNSINYDLERYDAFFDSLMPCSYMMNDGTSGRTHIGMISQDVQTALLETGLNSLDFAGFIKTPKDEGGFAYGLRYSEFIAINIWQIQQLKARVAELEKKL